MPKDYVPANDACLRIFVTNFVQELAPNLPKVGLASEELNEVTAALRDFQRALAAQENAEAAYRAAVIAKRAARRVLEQRFRPLVQRITHHPGMSDALRGQLGITVPRRGR